MPIRHRYLAFTIFIFFSITLFSCTPALNKAVIAGDNDLVKKLLEEGADVNSQAIYNDFYGGTPLSVASYNGNIDLVKLLIEKGADINFVDYNKRTPLSAACESDKTDIVKLLIENGADFNAERFLDFAAGTASYNVAKFFIEEFRDEIKLDPEDSILLFPFKINIDALWDNNSVNLNQESFNKNYMKLRPGNRIFSISLSYRIKHPGGSYTDWTGHRVDVDKLIEKGQIYIVDYELNGSVWSPKISN